MHGQGEGLVSSIPGQGMPESALNSETRCCLSIQLFKLIAPDAFLLLYVCAPPRSIPKVSNSIQIVSQESYIIRPL